MIKGKYMRCLIVRTMLFWQNIYFNKCSFQKPMFAYGVLVQDDGPAGKMRMNLSEVRKCTCAFEVTFALPYTWHPVINYILH